MVVRKLLSLIQQRAPSCQRIFKEHNVISWTKCFTVRVAEPGPKTRDHSIPSLETEIIILRYSRLDIYKMRMEKKLRLTISTNGESTRLCNIWNGFWIFGSVVPDCDWRIHFSKKKSYFFFFLVSSLLFCKTMCTITTIQL